MCAAVGVHAGDHGAGRDCARDGERHPVSISARGDGDVQGAAGIRSRSVVESCRDVEVGCRYRRALVLTLEDQRERFGYSNGVGVDRARVYAMGDLEMMGTMRGAGGLDRCAGFDFGGGRPAGAQGFKRGVGYEVVAFSGGDIYRGGVANRGSRRQSVTTRG